EWPLSFLRAVRSLLEPAGSCFGITPNLWHYFGLISAASARLGIEEALLRRVRPSDLVDTYHFPVKYRLNSLHRLTSVAIAAGFNAVEVRALEQSGMFETYFPDRLRWLPRRYSAAINRLGRPELFGTLIFRLVA